MEQKNTLGTENPNQLTYQNDLLSITVLGGIRLEGLDRLRITLKIELRHSSRPAVRHNLDLYNDTQLEKFIRKVSEKLEIATGLIEASLSELTAGLEGFRLEKLKSESETRPARKQLTDEEKKEALAFLSAPGLLERTNALIGKSGVIGEELNRLLMYLIFTSRKREQPLHVISLGGSGTGKTHLQEKVGNLIPEEDKIEVTTLSENAFYYFGQRELKNKLILIEDLDGAENALYPLRELQTKKRISKTVAHKNSKGETKTIHLVVEGPVSVAGCTTQEQIYEDNANRSFLLYLDESKEQDKRVMDYQRSMSAGTINTDEQEKTAAFICRCQHLLEPVRVINPYAELLDIPQAVFKPRRTNAHYLQFIEVITFYHQFQREKKTDETTGEVFIETALEDIANANDLLKEILLRKSDELTGACRNYLENIKGWLVQNRLAKFNNREIRRAFKVNESNQKRYTKSLLNNYCIRRVKGSRSRGFLYEVVSHEEYQQLRQKTASVLDETLQKLKAGFPQCGRSPVVQKQNGLHKLMEIKVSVPVVQKKRKMDARRQKKDPDGAQNTLDKIRAAFEDDPGRLFTAEDIKRLTGKSGRTERMYLKKLTDEGKLKRELHQHKYKYQLL